MSDILRIFTGIFNYSDTIMKKLLLPLMLLPFMVSAQVFFEDFQTAAGFAAWTTYDVDAQTPNAAVNYVTDAWVHNELDPNDSVITSTSWYDPAGQSDDWIVSPAIAMPATGPLSLSWTELAQDPQFPDGYEVYASTGGSTPADFLGASGTLIYSTPAASATEAAQSIDVSAFLGQTVHFAWRNNSNDQFLLHIDDILVDVPLAYDLQLVSFDSDATPQVTALNVNTSYSVLDFSGTSLFNASVTVENTGLNPVDTISVNYFIVDDINAPTAGSVVTKDFPQSPALAVGQQVVLNLDPIGLDTLFPTLASNQAMDIYVELDSSQFNPSVDVNDTYFSFLINPREAYTSPYSSSFEWVVGGTAFSFEHADWGWKFVNLDASGGSHYVNGFSNFANYDGEYMVYSALTPPNSLALGNAGDYFETPELSLPAGDYVVSMWGRGGFGFESVLDVELVNGSGATSSVGQFSSTLDTVNFTQNTAVVTIPSTDDDYKIRFVDAGGGFGVWDLMTLDALSAPVASGAIAGTDETNPFVEYCDGNIILSNTSTANGGTCTVDWGDGSATATIASGASLQHNYASNGTYTVTLTATNPAGSDQVTFDILVTDPPALDASFIIVDQGNGNVSITLENSFPCGGAQTTVNWGDGTSNNLTSHTYTADGDYTITVTLQTATDIAQSTGSVTITGLSTAIGELSLEDAMTVVPSPAVSDVNVSFSLFSVQDVTMTISTIEGRIVESRIIESAKTVNEAFDVRSLDNGIYMINVSTETGSTSSSFVVSH